MTCHTYIASPPVWVFVTLSHLQVNWESACYFTTHITARGIFDVILQLFIQSSLHRQQILPVHLPPFILLNFVIFSRKQKCRSAALCHSETGCSMFLLQESSVDYSSLEILSTGLRSWVMELTDKIQYSPRFYLFLGIISERKKAFNGTLQHSGKNSFSDQNKP